MSAGASSYYYAGFDNKYFPSHADTMADLFNNTDLSWCGYYLNAPSQTTYTGWLGERAYLEFPGLENSSHLCGASGPKPGRQCCVYLPIRSNVSRNCRRQSSVGGNGPGQWCNTNRLQ